MSRLLNIWKYIRRYKYYITIGVFVAIIGFIDENSMVRRAKNMSEINTLRGEIERYQKEYEESTERLNELTTNPAAMEKVAREKYLMKKPNEDIYVFEE